jgi:hypothetical protein
VTVTRIDRLARSTFDLFAIVKQIVDAKAQFRSLAEPWADTGTSTGNIGVKLMRDAFNKDKGPLTDLAQPEAEPEALAHLFAGAIGSYKNPHSYRDQA